ncbi:hypothetical protein AURDEDRAFT_152718 [Auricularia subglabra TFB-10046 SS5]|nr:hypothetical protein AURDEDRAFT_152718 [Auricularia subglabra TFB-10046 SS5]
MLRVLLARSDPLPFTVNWPDSRTQGRWNIIATPHDSVSVIVEHMHRMESLAFAPTMSDIQRLFAVPAPSLKSFRCTQSDVRCDLPVHWEAPLLETLEMRYVRVPEGMHALRSLRSFTCFSLDLWRTETQLFALFPSLRVLKIECVIKDTLDALSDPPASLTDIDLGTNQGPTTDYAPLIRACAGYDVRTLRLESAASFAEPLELFTSVVKGTWTMKLDEANERVIELSAVEEGASYRIDCEPTLSLLREPRVATQLARLASLTTHVHLLIDLDALGRWARTLPELRDLAIYFAAVERMGALPPTSRPPIRAQRLEVVAFHLNYATRGCESWVLDEFPKFLQSRFVLARPLLKSVTINTRAEAAPEEDRLSALLSLTSYLRINLLTYGSTREYSNDRNSIVPGAAS